MNDQTSGITVTITSATNTPIGGWPAFSTYISGNGFDVSAGAITGVDIYFTQGNAKLWLGKTIYSPELSTSDDSIRNYAYKSSLSFTPYTPTTAVPGPLPLLGTACAFRASRQLRRRLKATA
jgi:hypothetical protein